MSMRSLALCYSAATPTSPANSPPFSSRNCAGIISTIEGLFEPGGDLLETAERTLSADYLLIVLSPIRYPTLGCAPDGSEPLWTRRARLGRDHSYVLLRDCKFAGMFAEPHFSIYLRIGLRASARFEAVAVPAASLHRDCPLSFLNAPLDRDRERGSR